MITKTAIAFNNNETVSSDLSPNPESKCPKKAMDPETSSQIAVITDDNSVRNERIRKITYVVNAIIYIGSFIGYAITIALGVPMLQRCYNVAMVVMILGSVLGFLQQIPEFFRNFIKLEARNAARVNYILVVMVVLRVAWLIAATVVIVNSECNNITPAWVSIYVNWGTLAFVLLVILITTTVKFVKQRNQRHDD